MYPREMAQQRATPVPTISATSTTVTTAVETANPTASEEELSPFDSDLCSPETSGEGVGERGTTGDGAGVGVIVGDIT